VAQLLTGGKWASKKHTFVGGPVLMGQVPAHQMTRKSSGMKVTTSRGHCSWDVEFNESICNDGTEADSRGFW
jgi:hypothetical protein